MNSNEWREEINATIKNMDLYGRSFTYGVALYHLVKRAGCVGDIPEQFLDYVEMYHGEAMQALQNFGLDAQNAYAWIELLDLSELDEIARELMGEDEEDEDEE